MGTASYDFSDERVLIVGGTSGIGLTTARAFARSKARIAMFGLPFEGEGSVIQQCGRASSHGTGRTGAADYVVEPGVGVWVHNAAPTAMSPSFCMRSILAAWDNRPVVMQTKVMSSSGSIQ